MLYRKNRAVDEPFILASQAEQVWYVKDPLERDWHVVVKTTRRDYFDMYSKDFSGNIQVVPQVEAYSSQQLDGTTVVHNDDSVWVRQGMEGSTIDVTSNIDEDDIEM